MKANNKFFMRSDNAQVGIGTLIIFIAMVLVAAVAAAVLIQTSGVLQQKAQTTGKEATKEVSSNVAIDNIEGWRGGSQASDSAPDVFSTELYRLDIRASLKVGSEAVDMNQAVITITDGTSTNDLRYIEGELVTQAAYVGSAANGTNSTSDTTTTGSSNTTYRFLISDATSHTTVLNKIKKVYPDANTDSTFAANTSTGVFTSPFIWEKPNGGGSVLAIDAGVFDNYTYSKASTIGSIVNTTSFLVRGDIFYIIEEIRDEDKSFTKSNPVMNKGDLVKISILSAPSNVVGLSSNVAPAGDSQYLNNDPLVGESDLTITPRSSISINIVPEGGANTQVEFVAPSSFGVKSNVGLYP